MPSEPDDSSERDARLMAGIRGSLENSVSRLREAGARDEALGAFVAPRRLVIFTKKAAMVPLGRVWRLGVFLLDHEARLFAVGSSTRAVEPGYPGYQSISAEDRRDFRAAAFRGSFAEGETVNFNATEIALDPAALRASSDPLFIRDNRALVRWMPSAPDEAARELDAYLSERVGLLLESPGAS